MRTLDPSFSQEMEDAVLLEWDKNLSLALETQVSATMQLVASLYDAREKAQNRSARGRLFLAPVRGEHGGP